MIIEKFAPVLIPTLNRYEHLKRCLDSLAQNTHAKETHLYIALDAPIKEDHKKGYDRVVKYLDKISGFKEVTIIKRDKNLGPIRNTLESLGDLFKQYEQIILSEDDNLFSPNFLDYTNKGLQIFKDRKEIFAICGYNFSINIPTLYSENFYLGKSFSGWGCGLWKKKYEDVDLSVNSVSKFLKNYKNILKVNRVANYLLPKLFDIVENNHVTGDVIFLMNLIRKNMFCIFPTISKVRNCGNDGTGAHCAIDKKNIFTDQSIDSAKFFNFSNPDRVIENERLILMLKKKSRISNIEVIKRIILYLTRNTNLHKYYKKLKKYGRN